MKWDTPPTRTALDEWLDRTVRESPVPPWLANEVEPHPVVLLGPGGRFQKKIEAEDLLPSPQERRPWISRFTGLLARLFCCRMGVTDVFDE